MAHFFINIYRFFSKPKNLLWVILATITVGAMEQLQDDGPSLVHATHSLPHFVENKCNNPFITSIPNDDNLCYATVLTYCSHLKSGNEITIEHPIFTNLTPSQKVKNIKLPLLITALAIFFILLFAYGRIELALITFTPMFIAWCIILGLMALINIEFNIAVLVISMVILGVGSCFSALLMNKLLCNYKTGAPIRKNRKRLILFLAIPLLLVALSLIFAQYAGTKWLVFFSTLGLLLLIPLSHIIQPKLFYFFITSQTQRGGFPFSFLGFLNTLYAFGLFTLICFVVQLVILFTFFIPMKKEKRKAMINAIASFSTRTFLQVMVTTKMVNLNPENEDFKKPAVIIANHQSFIDILLLLGLHPKLIMVTNSWVWNSPFFGKIVRFLEFYHTANGYEHIAEQLEHKIKQGYSVIVFPEGTRSPDNKIKRFHKGAFYLADLLKLDILPILVYGNGLVSSKTQPFYIKKGYLLSKILPRISHGDNKFGTTYQERAKKVAAYFKKEYDTLYEEYNRVRNPYFKQALMMNYIFKGPVVEWYMRFKLNLENYYDHYDQLVPRKGHIVDLGCGYGAMSYMLMMLSDKRTVLGIDYDEKKITLANNSYAKNERIEFLTADLRMYDIPKADAFIISDVLHYIDTKAQTRVITHCIQNLNPGGVLLIRDGDKSLKERHKNTELTEKWSTKIMKFNKTDGDLHFLSKGEMLNIVHQFNMTLESVESDQLTSNTLYIIKHK